MSLLLYIIYYRIAFAVLGNKKDRSSQYPPLGFPNHFNGVSVYPIAMEEQIKKQTVYVSKDGHPLQNESSQMSLNFGDSFETNVFDMPIR